MDLAAILHGLRKIVNKINAIDFSGGTGFSLHVLHALTYAKVVPGQRNDRDRLILIRDYFSCADVRLRSP
jgi:hypothetical protein